MKSDPLSDLVALIYEAALDANLWPSVITSIADQVGAHFCNFGLYEPSGVVAAVAPRTEPRFMQSYVEHWGAYNPLPARTASFPVGKLFTPDLVIERDAFRRSIFFNEWWRPLGLGFGALGANIVVDGEAFGMAMVYKPYTVDSFTAAEQALFARLVPHLARSTEVHRRLHKAGVSGDLLGGAIDALDEGIIIVDRQARILFANQRTMEMLRSTDLVLEQGGAVSFDGKGDLIERMVANCRRAPEAAGGPGASCSVPRDGGRSPLRLLVVPYPESASRDRSWLTVREPTVVIFVIDPDVRLQRWQAKLVDGYGLTCAEAAFAAEILKGDGKHAAARRCGISYSTARSHLESIFDKTGVHRQAELVRLLIEG